METLVMFAKKYRPVVIISGFFMVGFLLGTLAGCSPQTAESKVAAQTAK